MNQEGYTPVSITLLRMQIMHLTFRLLVILEQLFQGGFYAAELPSLVVAMTRAGGFLPWKDWVRPTVTPDSPLEVAAASDFWPSCILEVSLESSDLGAMGRRCGGTREGGEERGSAGGEEGGIEGGAIEGGTSLVLWYGTGLARLRSPPESGPL